MASFSLGLLPTELLSHTIDYLSTSEKYALSQVSRKFRSIVRQDLTRPTNVTKICVDFAKEVLVIGREDLSWTVVVCETNNIDESKNAKQSMFLKEDDSEHEIRLEPKTMKSLSAVVFLDDEWNEYIGEFFRKLNKVHKAKPLGCLQMCLPEGAVPQSLLQCTVQCEELEIKRTDDTAPPPEELMPLIRKVTKKLKLDYMLTYTQLRELALYQIKCSVSGEDAITFLEDFYSKTLPDQACKWTIVNKGDFNTLMDRINFYSGGIIQFVPGRHTMAQITVGRYVNNIFYRENMMELRKREWRKRERRQRQQ